MAPTLCPEVKMLRLMDKDSRRRLGGDAAGGSRPFAADAAGGSRLAADAAGGSRYLLPFFFIASSAWSAAATVVQHHCFVNYGWFMQIHSHLLLYLYRFLETESFNLGWKGLIVTYSRLSNKSLPPFCETLPSLA